MELVARYLKTEAYMHKTSVKILLSNHYNQYPWRRNGSVISSCVVATRRGINTDETFFVSVYAHHMANGERYDMLGGFDSINSRFNKMLRH